MSSLVNAIVPALGPLAIEVPVIIGAIFFAAALPLPAALVAGVIGVSVPFPLIAPPEHVPATMPAAVYASHSSDTEVWQFSATEPVPKLASDTVLIKVHAAAINPVGTWASATTKPSACMCECA
eukprot:m.343222 g.343222  ORF g.343222 m.343222 type:complete len:124 (-) comp19849_c0_seq3:1276-1647(-)